MRERLIELLSEVGSDVTKFPTNNFIESLADYLLANGVIVPPCKVGDIFYGLNETSYDEYFVEGILYGKDESVITLVTTYDMQFVYGEEAFLFEEEAKDALKARERE